MAENELSSRRGRIVAGLAAVTVEALLGYALIFGLSVRVPAPVERVLTLFDVSPPKPEPVVRPRSQRQAGAAAPPNRRAHPVPVVAPLPIVPLPLIPPPLIAATVPALGPDSSAGATATPGPGTGGGGQGNGTGNGGAGTGDGGGTPARWRSGRIRDSDYPRAAMEADLQGDLATRYVIDARGRVTACSIVKSSGSPDLDATTCRLAVQRFRYIPARDASGRAVADVVIEDHHWVIER